MSDPIYTPDNSTPAYQLRWSLALFPRAELPPADAWLAPLKQATETDGVRVLECHRRAADVWQFLLSTLPTVAPSQIIRSVKGRLQHLLQAAHPKAFRRNFSLTSLGDANRAAVEQYVSDQLGHHRTADPRIEARLAQYQLEFPDVDLSRPVFSDHGPYVVNLHLVIVHAERWRDLAYAHGMQPVYQFGYYIGTFGEYDMDAVRRVTGAGE
ncbi:MAG TPA: hypothetical protein PLF81_09095 [Candidatus Anammoximicrobium sp.]|nr:hypothetical protein [Candidatus Anammoximicrobium sp.]